MNFVVQRDERCEGIGYPARVTSEGNDVSMRDTLSLNNIVAEQRMTKSETLPFRCSSLLLFRMKVSDPIIFGHGLRTFFKAAWEKHKSLLEEIGADAKVGLQSLLDTVDEKLPHDKALEIRKDFEACYEERPWIAMVDSGTQPNCFRSVFGSRFMRYTYLTILFACASRVSYPVDKGITNWHVPSDIIIDNSMPIVIRDGGKMYNKLGNLEDVSLTIALFFFFSPPTI